MKNIPGLSRDLYRKRALALMVTLFFSVQLLGVIVGRFDEAKFFSWAPYDQISYYEIEALRQGQNLSSETIRDRYHISPKGRENRSIHNIISIVRQYENSYGKGENVNITISYTINGHHSGTWTWPEDEYDRK